MFATPAQSSDYLSLEATFDDGTVKDLMRDLKVKHNSSPEFHHVGYKDYRWRIFFSNYLRHQNRSKQQLRFIEYLIENYTANIGNNKEIEKIKFIGYTHLIENNYDYSKIKRRVILKN